MSSSVTEPAVPSGAGRAAALAGSLGAAFLGTAQTAGSLSHALYSTANSTADAPIDAVAGAGLLTDKLDGKPLALESKFSFQDRVGGSD